MDALVAWTVYAAVMGRAKSSMLEGERGLRGGGASWPVGLNIEKQTQWKSLKSGVGYPATMRRR